jgi:hypothetical protein
MRFSRTLAVIFGVLAPLAETARRWHTWRGDPPALFDDYFMGAFLLLGAWAASRRWASGQRVLAAAWGFTCGLGYYSFFEQLRRYRIGETDPSAIPSGAVVAIKGVGILLAGAALVMTLAARPRTDDRKAAP